MWQISVDHGGGGEKEKKMMGKKGEKQDQGGKSRQADKGGPWEKKGGERRGVWQEKHEGQHGGPNDTPYDNVRFQCPGQTSRTGFSRKPLPQDF